MRSVITPTTSAAATASSSPTGSVSQGETPIFVTRKAAVYAPMPTKAACPKLVSPLTPVSRTRPSETIAYRPM